jgi:hypothetical protein
VHLFRLLKRNSYGKKLVAAGVVYGTEYGSILDAVKREYSIVTCGKKSLQPVKVSGGWYFVKDYANKVADSANIAQFLNDKCNKLLLPDDTPKAARQRYS